MKRASWIAYTGVFLILALVAGVIGCDSGGAVSAVMWLGDWEDAQWLAKSQDKPLIINFFTDWCPTCKTLDKETFTDAELGAFLNENFVNLKSNANKSDLHQRYGIPGVPTTVFATPSGDEITRVVGYLSADEFRRGAEMVLERWNQSANN